MPKMEGTLPGQATDSFVEEFANCDVNGVQVRSELTADGRFELPDPVPMELPIGVQAQPDLVEVIRNMVRSERLAAAASDGDLETFEEADDFDIADDPMEPLTQYERHFEPKGGPESTPPAPPGATGASGAPPAATPPAPPASPVQAASNAEQAQPAERASSQKS